MDTTVSSPGFCGGLLRPLPSCCCVLVFCLLWCDAAQGEVGAAGVVPVDPGSGFAFDLSDRARGRRSLGAPRCRSVLLCTRSSRLRPGRCRRSHRSNPPTPLPGIGRELARSARRGIGRLGRSGARAHECLYHRGDVGRSPCSTRPGPRRHAARTRLSSPRFYASTRPDEGDVDPASLSWHVGNVRDPQLVEITGPKMPIDQVQGACMARR